MPTKEELLRAGGTLQAKPSGFETVRRGFAQSISGTYGDEMAGVASATGTAIGRSLRRFGDGRLVPESIEGELDAMMGSYRKGRDEVREDNRRAELANPALWTASRVAGVLPLARVLGPVAGVGLRGAVTAGATQGAAEGLGGSEADLTRGEFGDAAMDTVKGGAMGAAFGAGGHALGQGTRYVGQRASNALENARGQMTDDARAAFESEEQLARQAALEAEVAMGKRQGQALQMDQRLSAQRERAARAGQRGAPRPQEAGPEEPDTAVLQGYVGKAGERRMVNHRNVRDYQRDLAADPDMNTAASSDLQQYIDDYGHAIQDPARFRREFVERYLRENHGADVAERIMRERISPDGRAVLPRPVAPGASQPAALPNRVRPLDAPWDSNAPQAVRAQPFQPLPQRRPGVQAIDVGGQRGPEFSQAATAGGAGAQDSVARAAEEAMAMRRAGAAGAGLQSGRPMPAPVQAPAAAPLEAPPTRLSPPPEGMDPTQVGRPNTQMFRDVADQREAAGGRDVRRAMSEGLSGQGAMGLGLAGVALNGAAGGAMGLALRAGGSAVGEMIQNPAARARTLSFLRLNRLAQADPATFGRVGQVLSRAMEQGPDKYRVAHHVMLQKDPDFREADRRAGEGLEGLSDEQLLRMIQGVQAR